MIGVDTNVLDSYLVEDDPRQAAEAARLIDADQAISDQLSAISLKPSDRSTEFR